MSLKLYDLHHLHIEEILSTAAKNAADQSGRSIKRQTYQ